jgi:hypothetical protein
MTAGWDYQADEDLGEGASEARPAVSFSWRLGRGPEAKEVWLDMFDGPSGRKAVAVPEGELGPEGLASLAEVVLRAQSCGVHHMTVDFSRVSHVDYRAVPGFMASLRRGEAAGIDYELVGLNRYLGEIFRAAGVELCEVPGGDDGAVCGAVTSAGEQVRPLASWEAPPRPDRFAQPGQAE